MIGLAVALSALISLAHSAAVPYRVKDIWPGAEDANVGGGMQAAGEFVYFRADDGVHGEEVWRSNGTEAGTAMVGNLGPGAEGTGAERFTPIGDRVFFWIDETDLGVVEGSPPTVRRIEQSIPYDEPRNLTDVRGQCYFTAKDPTGQRELFATDGTSVTPVVDLAGTASSDPSDIVDLDGTLFFAADTPEYGRELFKDFGIAFIGFEDIFPGVNAGGPNSSRPSGLTRFGDQILFAANDGVHGRELWTTDLRSARLLANLREDAPVTQWSSPEGFTVIGDRVYFDAHAQDGKRHLWVTDGTEDGTRLLPTPSWAWASRGRLAHLDGNVFFPAEVEPGVDALWVTRGEPTGTRILKSFTPRDPTQLPDRGLRIMSIAAAGPFAYFIVEDTTAYPYRQLWRTDGNEAGTVVVADFDRLVRREIEAVGDALFFIAEDADAGEELWAITACGDGVVGTAEECDDGNTEPNDCCTPSCRLPAPALTCDDGNACTAGDVCGRDGCAGSPIAGCGCGSGAVDPGEECDDGNRVDDDCCSNGCRAAPTGRACGDGNACTEADACDGAGTCAAGPEAACDDGKVCTLDGCDAARGCLHERVGFAGAQASLSAGIAATPCGPEPAMRRVRRHLGNAERLVGRAESASTRKTPKLLRRGLARLRKGARVLGRAADLTPSCAAGLTARFDEALARVTCLLDERRQVGR